MLKINIPQKLMDEKNIKLIIKSITDSRIQERENLLDRGFKTSNGRYQDRWNYLFNNIEQNFNNNRFKCYVVNRGPLWSFIALYDQNLKIIYIIFRKSTFLDINKNNEPNHYARMFNSINSRSIQPKEQIFIEQSFLKKDITLSNLYNHINKQLDHMIGEMQREAKLCVNVLFEESEDRLISISANIANYNLEIKKSYNWNEFITPTIEEIIDTESIGENNVDKLPPIGLKIRKEKFNKDKKNDLVDKKDKKDFIDNKNKN